MAVAKLLSPMEAEAVLAAGCVMYWVPAVLKLRLADTG